MHEDREGVPRVTRVERSLKPTFLTRLVKYEDMNHHRTLFAGRGAEWLIEACFIAAARAVGNPEDVVCAQIQGMTFKRPAHPGSLVEIVSQVGHVGGRSLTCVARATINGDPHSVVTCLCSFVTVDAAGRPYAHGIALPAEYVESNRELCDYARTSYENRQLSGGAAATRLWRPQAQDAPGAGSGS